MKTNSSAFHLYATIGDVDGRVVHCVCTDPSYAILVLGRGSTLYLSGCFSFQILYGCVCVNGFLFPSNRFNVSNFVNVAIPQGHLPASFAIRNDLSSEVHMERIQSRLREFVNDPRKMFPFVEERNPVAIVLIRMEMDIATRFVMQQARPLNLFPKTGKLGRNLYAMNLNLQQQNSEGTENYGLTEANIKSLKQMENDYLNVLNRIYRVIDKESGSSEFHYKIIHYATSITDCCIVPIIGNKGVGKSTICRYLVNALNTGEQNNPPKLSCRVFLLDLDVGQSEFSPPGCISLFETKKPMLGAPFASQETTLSNSYFFGSNNIGVDFELYRKLICTLLQLFNEIVNEQIINNEKCVLIVNTSGWIEDLGYDLTLSVIRILKTSIMVFLEMNGLINFNVPFPYTRKSMRIKRNQIMHSTLTPLGRPALLRNFLVAGYLAKSFGLLNMKIPVGADLRLADNAPAYRLPFRSTSIYIHPELRHVQDKFMLSALNCSLVALCRIEEKYSKLFERHHLLGDESLPARLVFRPRKEMPSFESGEIDEEEIVALNDDESTNKQFPVLRCIGFGLIRAINPERKLFYIITPIEQRQLGQVDVLALGHCLNTPEFLFDTASYEAVPYLVELRESENHQKKFFSPLRVITGSKRGLLARSMTNAKRGRFN